MSQVLILPGQFYFSVTIGHPDAIKPTIVLIKFYQCGEKENFTGAFATCKANVLQDFSRRQGNVHKSYKPYVSQVRQTTVKYRKTASEAMAVLTPLEYNLATIEGMVAHITKNAP